MGRKASAYVWRGWFVTDAGDKRYHKLCPVEAGHDKAAELLEKWLEDLRYHKRKDAEDGIVQTDTPYTVFQIAGEFIQAKRATKRERTAHHYQEAIKAWVDLYREVELQDLKLNHGMKFLEHLKSLGLEGVTINRRIGAAKSALNYAVDCDIIRKNPWKKVPKLPERQRKRTVTDSEFEKLLEACDKSIAYRGRVSKEDNAQLMKDMLRLLRFTGLRPGELRKLRWEHVRDGLINIPAEEQKTGTTAKNPENRIVPVLEEGMAILRARKEKYGDQPLVFPNVCGNGNAITDEGFSRRFAKLRKRAKLDTPDQNGEMLVPYSLRHTRLTEAGVQEKWSPFTLMRFAGHTNPKMTKRYVHPEAEDLMREAREGQKRRLSVAEA